MLCTDSTKGAVLGLQCCCLGSSVFWGVSKGPIKYGTKVKTDGWGEGGQGGEAGAYQERGAVAWGHRCSRWTPLA